MRNRARRPYAYRHLKRELAEKDYERARELLFSRRDYAEWRQAKRSVHPGVSISSPERGAP